MMKSEEQYRALEDKLLSSKKEVEAASGFPWEDVEFLVLGLEDELKFWTEDDIAIIPLGLRNMILARHFYGVTDDAAYISEINEVKTLRVKALVDRYNRSMRERRILLEDLLSVDEDGRVLVNLDAIRSELGGDEQDSEVGGGAG